YLPALSDVILMVDKTSFMGLGGPNLVKGAVGQVTDAETLGGAKMHTNVSGVAHYRAANDEDCLCMIRRHFSQMPEPPPVLHGSDPVRDSEALYDILPPDHRLPYRMEELLACILDAGDILEFQPDYA